MPPVYHREGVAGVGSASELSPPAVERPTQPPAVGQHQIDSAGEELRYVHIHIVIIVNVFAYDKEAHIAFIGDVVVVTLRTAVMGWLSSGSPVRMLWTA